MYKVRNILDNSLYAIKKIKLRPDKNSVDLLKEINGVLQEVRYLAKLKSEYIVNYNHSWVQVTLKEQKVVCEDENEEDFELYEWRNFKTFKSAPKKDYMDIDIEFFSDESIKEKEEKESNYTSNKTPNDKDDLIIIAGKEY